MNQEQTQEQKISSSTKDALATAIGELNTKISAKEEEVSKLKAEKKSLTDFYEAQTGMRFKMTPASAATNSVEENGNGAQKTKRTYNSRKSNPKKYAAKKGTKPKALKPNREKATKTTRVAEDSPIVRDTPIKPTKVPASIMSQFEEGKGVKAKILWAMQQMGGKATRKELKTFLSKDLVGKQFNDNVYWAIRMGDIKKSKDGETLHLQRWEFND